MLELKFECPENRAGMNKVKAGFFCGACQKKVIDFRTKTAEEINAFLATSTGETCGVVQREKLAKPYVNIIGSRFRLAFLMVFMLGFNAADLHAQDTLSVLTPSKVEVATSNSMQLEGYVYLGADSTGLPFTRIKIQQGEKVSYAKSDFDGYFCVDFTGDTSGEISVSFMSVFTDTLTVDGISPTEEYTYLEVFIEENESDWIIVGLFAPFPPLIPKDPYEMGKTSISNDDLIHRP